MRSFSSHDCLTPSLLSVSLSVFIPCTLALFIAPPQPVPPCLFLFAGSVSPYLSPLAEARVSLLALQTITSIHQLSAQSSLASSLPFSQRWDNNPHSPAYTCSFATPFSQLPPLWAAECTSQHTWSPFPSNSFVFLHPSCSLPHTRCPSSVCVCVYVEREDRNKGMGCRVGGQIEVCEWVV